MTKSRIAEWILSQVLPPDRAAATVGDWLEDADQRGNFWFWSCVLRTFVSRIWSDLTENPSMTARLRLTAFSRILLVPAGYTALMIVLVLITGNHTDLRQRHDWIYTYIITVRQAQPFASLDFTWPFQLVFHLFWAKRLFQTPRWIARFAPGREFAGSIAVALVGWTMILAYAILWLKVINFGNMPRPRLNPTLVPMGVAHDLILLAGALWLRRRQFHPAAR